MKKRILFITPTLGRTGSEMMLWYILNNIDSDKYEPFVFVLYRGGNYDKLPVGISKYLAYKASGKWYKKLFRGFLKIINIEPVAYQLTKIQKKTKADLWYANTLTVFQAFDAAKKNQVKVFTHIHESLFAYSFISANSFRKVISNSSCLIGCSQKVVRELSYTQHPNIKLQPCFIDFQQIHFKRNEEYLRDSLKIKRDSFVWAISGSVFYMKGVEYLLSLLDKYKNENVVFLWLGAKKNDGLNAYLEMIEVKNPGKLIFTGSLEESYYDYLKMANGFLLLSKEETFSLVLLEAAYCELPIVSFNTGIAAEFVTDQMGRVIEDYNINEFAEAMKFYVDGGAYNKAILKNAALQFSAEKQLPKFFNLLETI